MNKEKSKMHNGILHKVFLLLMGLSPVLNTIGSIYDLKLALELSSFKNNAVQTEAKVISFSKKKSTGRRGISAIETIFYQFNDIEGNNKSASYRTYSMKCLPDRPRFTIAYSKLNPQVNHIGTISDISIYIQRLVVWGGGLIVLAWFVFYVFIWHQQDFVYFLVIILFMVNGLLIALGVVRALSGITPSPINLTQRCSELFRPQ